VAYFELDLEAVAAELATAVPGVVSVHLFGSRKYPGKTRSDLDLLVIGPANLASLVEFRDQAEHRKPLDLWLVTGGAAASAVNGSVLLVDALETVELYPQPALSHDLQMQQFRSDIEYKMTILPSGSFVPVRGDHLGLQARSAKLLDASIDVAANGIVDVLGNGLEALRRMRGDAHARRGKGTLPTILTEYDLQNLVELVLAPVIGLEREPFTVECQGIKRTADFSFAGGRIVVELKFSKSTSDLGGAVKDAQAALSCYLNHPGVEVALAVLAHTPDVNVDRNALESWSEVRGARRAMIKVVAVPEELLTEHKSA
jgi:hypothetical protein